MQLQKAIEESKKDNLLAVNPDVMTYEDLVALGEKLGTVDKGFSPEEIKLIPTKRIL